MGNVIRREIGYEIDDEIDAPVVPKEFDNEIKIEKEENIIEQNKMTLENEYEVEEEEDPKLKSKPPINIDNEEIEEEEKEKEEEKEDEKEIINDNVEQPSINNRNRGNNRYSRIFLGAYKKRNDKVEIREDENVKEDILNLYI